MKPPTSPFRTAFPLAANLVWFWAGMVVLLLLEVRFLLPPNAASPGFVEWTQGNPWRESGAPARLVRIQVLLATWLWVSHRSQRLTDSIRLSRGSVGLLAAGVLLLVLAYAVMVFARPPTSLWELTRIHP